MLDDSYDLSSSVLGLWWTVIKLLSRLQAQLCQKVASLLKATRDGANITDSIKAGDIDPVTAFYKLYRIISVPSVLNVGLFGLSLSSLYGSRNGLIHRTETNKCMSKSSLT